MKAYKGRVMKKMILLITLTISTFSFAGPGHGHSHGNKAPAVKMEKTQEIGKYHVDRLVKAKKIDASWSTATYAISEKKRFGHKVEWVVTFTNDKGVKGKKIFVFLRLSGEFVAVNFTGK